MNATSSQPKGLGPIIIIGVLFFAFGFITWANSQLIPYLKIACQLTDTQSYLVASAFFAAYFITSIPSSHILKKTGYKKGMSLGLTIMALGAIIFIPAANTRSFPLFLTGLFIQGTGLSLLQTASNPYVTILGPISSAAQRISIMGICNKVAGILAVLILGGITLKNADQFTAGLKLMDDASKAVALNELAQRVVTPYIVITAALVALAVILLFMHLPEVVEEANKEESTLNGATTAKTSVLQYPHLVLGAIAIFFYVGVEVMSYDTFSTLGTTVGYTLDSAKTFAAVTGIAMLAGYLLSIVLIPKVVSQRAGLIFATLVCILLVTLASVLKGSPDIKYLNLGFEKLNIPLHPATVCFALLGFFNSIMWPAIWPLSLDRLGRFTKIGGALLIMGIVGGAVLPPLYGALSAAMGSAQLGYIIMIPCYLYILFFAVKGYKAT